MKILPNSYIKGKGLTKQPLVTTLGRGEAFRERMVRLMGRDKFLSSWGSCGPKAAGAMVLSGSVLRNSNLPVRGCRFLACLVSKQPVQHRSVDGQA